MLHLQGVSHLLEGQLEQADVVLSHAGDLAAAHGTLPLIGLVLAERSVVAIARDDWPAADSFAREGLGIVDDGGFEGYWTSALVLATAARCAAHRGDIATARQLVRRTSLLRPLLTYALPVVSVQALVQLAHAYLGFAELGGARAVLAQARAILQQRPDLGMLSGSVQALQQRAGLVESDSRGMSSLTAAELRLIPLLPTHLSMPEIGAQLHISRHTVKSQVISLYRKLGVSSRSEAVARLADLHLFA
jgi:LuxR family maltose regulon positive regulatory protein